jgi:hypothetical protein
MKIAGNDPPGLCCDIAAVGLMSAFIQNIGSASCFTAILDVSAGERYLAPD